MGASLLWASRASVQADKLDVTRDRGELGLSRDHRSSRPVCLTVMTFQEQWLLVPRHLSSPKQSPFSASLTQNPPAKGIPGNSPNSQARPTCTVQPGDGRDTLGHV